ncbi:hypothetical protein PanWU01x14_205680 [Parasponia andersonii]|uniref:Uncharacterized protein n=1 Tax=Parasponia andersonii TaxID=3476 RepID=A0A2P5BVQ9_PARAD|nr:hypothetical protein PanWU01x14_205680 [Parasponia andersonii]
MTYYSYLPPLSYLREAVPMPTTFVTHSHSSASYFPHLLDNWKLILDQGKVVSFNGKFYWLDGVVPHKAIFEFGPELNECRFITIHFPIFDLSSISTATFRRNMFSRVCKGQLQLISKVVQKIKGE